MEFYASYVYLSMSNYFSRDDQALPGFAAHFAKESEEEREHGMKLIACSRSPRPRTPRLTLTSRTLSTSSWRIRWPQSRASETRSQSSRGSETALDSSSLTRRWLHELATHGDGCMNWDLGIQ